jgi:hypothetical protein
MGWKQLEGSSEFFFSQYAYIKIVRASLSKIERRSIVA